mmetsp:Transcript_59149/g.139299  ORF Transcript_59149/g.139299 Transcript_59149/m.139299 type:complete len:239 (+) Transcript_59149:3674-4390(+)
MAVVGQPIQKRRGHLGVAEDAGPFAEAQVGGDDHAGVLVELGEQMEQQRPAGLAERQVAELVQDEQVHVHQPVRDLPGLAGGLLGFQRVNQLHRRLEAHPFAVPLDGLDAQRRGQVRLARARPADEHHVVRGLGELRRVQFAHQRLIDCAGLEVEAGQIAVRREARRRHLVRDGAHVALSAFGVQQLFDQLLGFQRRVAAVRHQLGPVGRHAVQLERLQPRDDLGAHERASCGLRSAS